jgi:exopolysaccharide production protein ExoZ
MIITKDASLETNKKLELIQALRGIAAILVVGYHIGTLYSLNLNWLVFNNAFKFGHIGVVFFFVLSGFIIYYTHYNDWGKPLQLSSYIYRRFMRIFPVYWIILSLKLFIKHIDLLSILLAFSLIPIKIPYVNVSWTLSYEILFYACFGILIYRLNNYTKTLFLILISIIFVRILITLTGYNINFDNFYLSFLFNPHIIEFALGILAGYIVIKKKAVKWRSSLLICGIFIFSLNALLTVLSVNTIAAGMNATPYYQATKIYCFLETNASVFFGLPFFLIVIGAAMIDLYDSIRVPKLFLKIGDASYSIYLVHAILINNITLKLFAINTSYLNYTILPVMIASVLAGYCFHLIIEKPILNFFHTYHSKFNKVVVNENYKN